MPSGGQKVSDLGLKFHSRVGQTYMTAASQTSISRNFYSSQKRRLSALMWPTGLGIGWGVSRSDFTNFFRPRFETSADKKSEILLEHVTLFSLILGQ